MKAIIKYPIPFEHFGEAFNMNLPKNAQILDVQMQQGKAMLWAIVDSASATFDVKPRRFVIFKEGNILPIEITRQHYLGTWQNESMVLHMFEAPRI